MKADGIVEVPQGVEGYESGVTVSVRLLRPEDELRRCIVAIGSHDPLLDELSELLRVEYGDISMGSAHVGSMGGLLAVRRGEAHFAATHLLDEDTGEYNLSFVRRYFPKGGVRLVECVKRTQGLILQKGNPGGIKGVADLAREGLRYVNRQKGSGTRILIDYLCRENGIDTSAIYGYNREEYTHTSVAALIAANSADAGLGVFSAAKLYGLDFVPLCEEQYDLLVPDHAWDIPMMQKLLEVLKSEKFRQRLDLLGGYVAEAPGEVRMVF
jgi:putative molybdopterin biosynthesis protein